MLLANKKIRNLKRLHHLRAEVINSSVLMERRKRNEKLWVITENLLFDHADNRHARKSLCHIKSTSLLLLLMPKTVVKESLFER